jgi:O-antigen/teichoic acid export membrane protein
MKKKIASSFGLTLISSGLLFGFNFAIAKILGADVYGQISYYLSFVQMVVLLVSFNYAALYMGNKITREDPNTFSLFVSVESVAFLIVVIPAFFVINKYINSIEITMLILFIAYFLTITTLVGLKYNADKEVSLSILYSTLIPRVILIVLFLAILFFSVGTATNYLYIYLFSLIVISGYFLFKFSPKWYMKKEIFSRAWKFYLLGIIGGSVTYIAQIFQKEYGSYTELASLAIGMLLITGLSLVGGILIKFALPKIHEAWKERNIEQLGNLYATHTFLSSMINIPVLIFLIYFIEPIAKYMGEGYSSLPIVFYILSVGYLFDLMTGITGTILRATEHEHIEIYNEIFRFVVGISLIYLLHNQPYGIAYAISASMVIYNTAKFFQVYRLFGLKPIHFKNFLILVMYSVILSIMLYGVSFIDNSTIALLIASIMLLVYYAVAYKNMKKIISLEIYK